MTVIYARSSDASLSATPVGSQRLISAKGMASPEPPRSTSHAPTRLQNLEPTIHTDGGLLSSAASSMPLLNSAVAHPPGSMGMEKSAGGELSFWLWLLAKKTALLS